MTSTGPFPSSPTSIPPIYTASYPYNPQTPPSPSTYSHPHSDSLTSSTTSTAATSVFSYPSPTKSTPATPNAHPYAIKTTSTAILSRSNSNAAQTSNAVHRYVPRSSPSPSPISPSFTGIDGDEHEGEAPVDLDRRGSSASRRRNKHRYSRSMTDVPLPMPIPPNVVNNAQSYYMGYSPTASPSGRVRERARSLTGESNDEDETPRRTSNGHTPASSMGPPSTPLSTIHRHSKSYSGSSSGLNGIDRLELSLPEDPKTWSSRQVAGYLTALLRERGHHISRPLANFVSEMQITGKSFLRLTEGDLSSSDTLSPAARETLLQASHTLRQSVLRERIFPSRSSFSSNSPFDMASDRQDSDDEMERVTLNGVTIRRRNRMVKPQTLGRSRNSSLSSTSSSASSSGRVREMVNELERTASTDSAGLDEEGTVSSMSGSRSASPSKASQVHKERVDQSPTKQNSRRGLPQRPRVNDLFSSPNPILSPNYDGSISTASTPGSNREVEDKEQDETITRVAKRNVNGREPRLLPFPPTNASAGVSGTLTPAHTGTQFPLPPTPDQRSLHQQHSGPGDYELGFRNAVSPQSAAYVVRYGPSPSNVSMRPNSGSGAQGSRLLPYPPVSSETALHHPRPQRAVGVADRDAGLSPDADVSDPTSPNNGDDPWTTARESQNSSGAYGSSEPEHESGTTSGEGGDGERSVAELLREQEKGGAGTSSSTMHVSGAEAWEMELGDTVKRIQGEVNGTGKKATAAKERGRATGKDRDALRRPGVLGLFNETSPTLLAQGDQSENPSRNGQHEHDRDEQFGERVRGVVADAVKVRERGEELDERERELHEKEVELAKKEAEILEKEKVVHERADEVDNLHNQVEERLRSADEKHQDVDLKALEIECKAQEVDQKALEVEQKSQDVDQKVLEFEQKSQEVDLKAEEVDRNSDQNKVRANELQQKSHNIDKKLMEIEERSQAIDDRHAALNDREKELEERNLLTSKEVEVRSQALNQREATLIAREQEVSANVHKIEERAVTLQALQASLDERALGISDDAEKQSADVAKRIQIVEDRERALAQKAQELEERQGTLDARERDMQSLQESLTKREQALSSQRKANRDLNARQESLTEREQALSRRERNADDDAHDKLAMQELVLEERAAALDAQARALQLREETLDQRTRDISAREEAAWNKEDALAEREEATTKVEATVLAEKRRVSIREETLGARADASASGVEQLNKRQEDLRRREVAVEEREAAVARTKEDNSVGYAHTHAQKHELLQPAPRSTIGMHILRQCWNTFVLPVVGAERTPAFLCTPPLAPAEPARRASLAQYLVPPWAIRRDAILGRFMGLGGLAEGYLVLMGLGFVLFSLLLLNDYLLFVYLRPATTPDDIPHHFVI